MEYAEILETCLGHLDETPFIERAVLCAKRGPAPVDRGRRPDGELDLRLVDGTTARAVVEIKRTNVLKALAPQIKDQLAQFGDRLPFLFARQITPGLGDLLAQLHLNYVDLAGNRYVNIDDRYIARRRRGRGP